MADRPMKTVDGKHLPTSAFAYVPNPAEPSTWKLRIDDAAHVGGAAAALGPGYRGEKVDIPEKDRAAVIAKVRAAWRTFHPDGSDDEMPEAIRTSEPTPSSLHVNGMVKTEERQKAGEPSPLGDQDGSEEEETEEEALPDRNPDDAGTSESMSPHYLPKLVEHLKAKVTAQDYEDAVKKARAHAGGKARHKAAEGDAKAKIVDPDPDGDGDAAEDDDDDGDGAGNLAMAENPAYALAVRSLCFTDLPTWIPFLPVPGTYRHPSYGEIKLTRERIGRFVQHFNEGVYQKQVPLDAEHHTKLSGATAWITRLRQNPNGSADAMVEWTDIGRTFLEQKRFKFVSPEWYDAWENPATGQTIKDVIIGGAITTRPFFKESALRPLAASEDGDRRTFLPIFATKGARTMAEPYNHTHGHDNGDGGIHEHEHNHAGDTPKGDEHAKVPHGGHSHAGVAMSEKRFSEMEAQLKVFQEKAAAQEAQLKQATEEIATMRKDARRKRFTEEVTGKSSANGARWTGDAARHVGFLERLADSFGEDSEEVRHYVSEQRTHAVQMRESALLRETGAEGFSEEGVGENPERKALKMAEGKVQGNPKLSPEDALDQVFAENPELYEQYRRSVTLKV